MPKLIIQDNLNLQRPKVVPVEIGSTIDKELRKEFALFEFGLNKLMLNGAKILPGDSSLFTELKQGDVITVIQEVKGFLKNFGNLLTPFATGMFDEVGKLFDWIIDLPDSPDTDRSSPNNSFSSQTNIMRAFSQLPVVVGSPNVYPDLAGDAIEFYNDNVKRSEQTFIVSFGTFTSGIISAGNTEISRFPGALASRFLPDPVTKITTIPDYRIGKSVDEVDGQTIKGTNEGTDGTFVECVGAALFPSSYSGTTFTINIEKDTNGLALKSLYDAGQQNFKVTYKIEADDGGGALEEKYVTGTGFMSSLTDNSTHYTVVMTTFNGEKSETTYFDEFDFTAVISSSLGPFTNPIQCEKMFFNIKFDRGLKATVELEVKAYQLDAQGGNRIGTPQTFNVTYTDDTLDATYFTFTADLSAGRDWYEFEVRRTNEATEKTDRPDIATLEKVYCIQELGDFDFYNVTMLQVKMPTTQIPTGSGVDTKINIKNGFQNMPSYDLATKTITADAESRSFADAILFVWRDFLEKDVDKLNLDELYTIEKSIKDTYGDEFSYFDYTYDDVEQSAGERIDLALNVARCGRYSDANQIRFWRDEKVDFPSALLGRSDMASESNREYTLTRANYVDGDFDSVQVEYVDRELNKKAYIYRSISGGNFVNVTGENPKKVVLTGCQSLAVASNRADLEIRKMVYQRWTLSDTFIDAHRFRDKGDVVIYNEVYENVAAGGDVKAINGNSVVTSGKIELESGENYQVYFTNLYGEIVGPYPISSSGDNDITVASLSSEVYARGFEKSQLGSRYLVLKINDSIKRQYRIIEKATSGYNVQLSMINYDERIYDNDL